MSKSWKKGRASFLCRHHLSARRWEGCDWGGRTAQRHGLIVRKTWTTRRPPRSDVTGIRRSKRKSRVKPDVFWVILNSRGSFLFCELLEIGQHAVSHQTRGARTAGKWNENQVAKRKCENGEKSDKITPHVTGRLRKKRSQVVIHARPGGRARSRPKDMYAEPSSPVSWSGGSCSGTF